MHRVKVWAPLFAPSFCEICKRNAKIQALEVLMDIQVVREFLPLLGGSLLSPILGSSTSSLKTFYPKFLANLTLDVQMEILCSFESSVNICQSKLRNIPEDLVFHSKS
jgi:hypothetical protein